MTAAVSLPVIDDRPRVRSDCAPAAGTKWSVRPCTWEGCRYHARQARFRGGYDKAASCSLDAATRSHTMSEVGERFYVSRERVRQIEAAALRKLREACDRRGLRLADLFDGPGDDDDPADDEEPTWPPTPPPATGRP